MATMSFTKKPKAAAVQTAESEMELEQRPAKLATQAPMVPPKVNVSVQLLGEFSARDMAIPHLNLGQKAGIMCDEHPEWVGQWVYDRTYCIGPQLRIVPCRIQKKYEQVLEYGSAESPQTFETKAAAQQAGVEVRDLAEIDVLVECEGEDMRQFAMLEADGKAYAPARYLVRSSAYGRTVGILVKDVLGWLKNDLASGFYTLSPEKRTGNGNSWYVPKLAADGKVGENLRNAIRETFGV